MLVSAVLTYLLQYIDIHFGLTYLLSFSLPSFFFPNKTKAFLCIGLCIPHATNPRDFLDSFILFYIFCIRFILFRLHSGNFCDIFYVTPLHIVYAVAVFNQSLVSRQTFEKICAEHNQICVPLTRWTIIILSHFNFAHFDRITVGKYSILSNRLQFFCVFFLFGHRSNHHVRQSIAYTRTTDISSVIRFVTNFAEVL